MSRPDSKTRTRWILHLRTIVFTALLCVDTGYAIAQKETATRAYMQPLDKVLLEDGDSVVFLGDSITHQRLYTQYLEDYLLTRYPHKRFRMHNAGVGGAKAWDALQRFDEDVAAYKPKYVTVLLGMNDGRYSPFHQEYFDIYQKDMTTLIEKIKSIGATPVLLTPTIFDGRARDHYIKNNRIVGEALQLYNGTLAYYGSWVREVAVDSGYGFVDMYGPMNLLTVQQRKADPLFTLARDGVHPDPPGQVVMAYAMVQDMGLQKQLSSIRISKNAKKSFVANASGGTVSNLTETEEGLRFTWLADGLPWVVPSQAQAGAKLTKLGHRLSREALTVHGLPTGFYQLSIDGQDVATFHANRLATHVELQENASTPQHQQAMQVAQLNKARNEGPIGKIRGLWSLFQRYARLKATENLNEAQRTQLDQYEKQLADRSVKVAGWNAESDKMLDQIYEINKPLARKYELKKVPAPKRKQAAK